MAVTSKVERQRNLSADQEGEAKDDAEARVPVMFWPDVANEPAHDHPVFAALLFW